MKIVNLSHSCLLASMVSVAFCWTSLTFAQVQTMTYQNQRGSLLTLSWQNETNDTGSLQGTFSTAVGNCKEDMNTPVPITGFYNGNAIAVTINFPHCKQVVAMTGHLSQNKNEIHTLWLDAAQAKDPTRSDWTANVAGADHYHKVTTDTKKN
jgi:hypothetical protein